MSPEPQKAKIVHMHGDEEALVWGEQMRKLAEAAEKHFGLSKLIEWHDADFSLRNRTATENGVVDEATALVQECRFGIKDATITLEEDDPRPGIRKSPNGRMRRGILSPESLGAVIFRESRPLPGVTPNVTGKGYEEFTTGIVRQGAGGFYGADVSYTGGNPSIFSPQQHVKVLETVSRSQHRAAAMFSFMRAHQANNNGRATETHVVGGPKFTIHDGDGVFQREIRRARDIFSGVGVEKLDGKGILYKEDDLDRYRAEIKAEREKLGLKGVSEEALVKYNEQLIDALYAWLLHSGPSRLGSTGANMIIPANNRDGDCLSDMIGAAYKSIAGMTSEIMAIDGDYKVTATIAEAAHGTAPTLKGQNKANPLAMFLALATIYKRISQDAKLQESEVAQNCAIASQAITRACMTAINEGHKTCDLGGSTTTTDFTKAVIDRLAATVS